MKLNFWQWLGVALLIGGGSLYIYDHTSRHTSDPVIPPTTNTSPGTQAS